MSQGRALSKLIGVNIQERRKKLGLTQENLAEKIGVGQQSLSRMERGDIAPKLERLPDVAATLQCSGGGLFRSTAGTVTIWRGLWKKPWRVWIKRKKNTLCV